MFKVFLSLIFSLVLLSPSSFAVPISPPIPLGSGITASDMAFLEHSMNPNQLKILNFCMMSNLVKNQRPSQAYILCRKLAFATERDLRTPQQLDKFLRNLMDAR